MTQLIEESVGCVLCLYAFNCLNFLPIVSKNCIPKCILGKLGQVFDTLRAKNVPEFNISIIFARAWGHNFRYTTN